MTTKNNGEYNGEFGVNNQLYFCGVPFRLDSYSGCTHQCRYCFARSSDLTNNAVVGKKELDRIVVPDKTHFMKQMVIALDQGGNRADINIEWLQRRVPIHWGGMSDPFQPAELHYKISSAWMDRINWYQYPVAISTKGTRILTSPEYMTKLKAGKYAVQVTCIGQDDELIKQLEPGAPLVSERIDDLKRLADAGFWTAVRIQPVMPGSSLERDLPNYIRTLAKAGVRHILAEGYKVPMRSSEWMKEVWKLFPETAIEYAAYKTDYFGFEKLLPSWRKYKYIKVIKQACHENGMTFGAADNDLRDLGDTICCCGLDNIPGFENFWRYQASQAVDIAKKKGSVSLEDMQQFWSGGKNSMDSGNTLNQEMYEEVYGYKKGEAAKNKERKNNGGGLLGVQDGEMRRQARASGTRYTAQYCVDWMWNNGGECSPEGIFSMKRTVDKSGNVLYTYENPIPKLEAGDITQATLF